MRRLTSNREPSKGSRPPAMMRGEQSSPTPHAIIATLLLLAPTLLACTTRDDDYLLLRRAPADPPGQLRMAARNDGEALYVRQLLSNGFGAELLRTYAMTKRFAAKTAGYHATPTTIALGPYDINPVDPAPRRRVDIGWWGTTLARDQPIIWIDDSPERDNLGTMTKLVSAFGDEIVEVIAPETSTVYGDSPSSALRWGYMAFLQVVAAEWRTPAPIDDRDELRRIHLFADVRANAGVRRSSGDAGAMINDSTVVATVLYRMACSDLGQKMDEPAFYRPFLEVQPPRDVHPALLLGAFRNFQAKLLGAWSRARASGRPPHDLIDLVEAYGDAHPAERAEATRIFLVTTYGATALPDAVRADAAPAEVETRLAALTADVLFGRRGLRDGFHDR
jgi:hypothetical protein